jgi:hypothetical protein
MASAETAIAPEPTLLDSIWQSIITPGAGPGLVATINGSLLLLILIVLVLSVLGWFDMHLMVLMFLSIGLLLSLNWCVQRLSVPAFCTSYASAARTQAMSLAYHTHELLRHVTCRFVSLAPPPESDTKRDDASSAASAKPHGE